MYCVVTLSLYVPNYLYSIGSCFTHNKLMCASINVPHTFTIAIDIVAAILV